MPSRLGVGIPWQWEEFYPGWTPKTLSALGEPYWHNWKYDQIAHPRYNPSLYRCDTTLRDGRTPNPHWEKALKLAGQYGSSRLWFLGNEPHENHDGNMSPMEYAYWAMRFGPIAEEKYGKRPLVAGGGGAIVNTPTGREWFRQYLTYNQPLDSVQFFHIHLYYNGGIQEWLNDWEAYKQMCGAAFRPTIVSETNLYTGTIALQMGLMNKILEIAGPNSGLHYVAWYADRDYFGHWPWCALREMDGSLTPLGAHFRAKQR